MHHVSFGATVIAVAVSSTESIAHFKPVTAVKI